MEHSIDTKKAKKQRKRSIHVLEGHTPERNDCAPLQQAAPFTEMVYHRDMRTSITLNEQVHEFASVYASARGISLSSAINELIRKAQSAPPREPEISRGPNGLPMFPPTGKTITAEMVKKIEAEES